MEIKDKNLVQFNKTEGKAFKSDV